MKKSKIIKGLSIILVAALLVSNVASAKEYDIYTYYVKGNKMINFYSGKYLMFDVTKKNNTDYIYCYGNVLETISKNKYYVECTKGETSCLFKMKVMKNKIKFTINDGDYQNVGKYCVGTWKKK